MQSINKALSQFLGRKVEGILRVVVQVETERFVLPDTMVFVLDGSYVQIWTDTAAKRVERIASLGEVFIAGDYDDRTGVTFEPVDVAFLPLMVSSVYVLYEVVADPSKEYLVGALFYGESSDTALSVNMHLDDVEVGDMDVLWRYVARIIPHARRLTVERLAAFERLP